MSKISESLWFTISSHLDIISSSAGLLEGEIIMPRPEIVRDVLAHPGRLKSLSCFDLTYLILMAAYDIEPSPIEKEAIHASVLKALDNHWCNFDILSAVLNEIQDNRSTGLLPPGSYLDSFIGSVNTAKGRNLINTGKIYYHGYMLLMPPPATIQWDDNAGTSVTIQEPYYCENKCEVTLSDICDYFISKSVEAYGERGRCYSKPFIIGIINKWSEEPAFDVDHLLFAIDDTIYSREHMPVRSFLDVKDHMFQASEAIKGKQETIMSSDDKGGVSFVIPKLRELLY